MKEMNLPDKVKKIIDEFVTHMKNAYGEGLVSVILYGSAASGEYAGRHSNFNMAVILKDTSIGSLSKVSGFINKRKFMIINPIFFTEDYIKRSTDVFPIEFIDMKENHFALYGRDLFKDIDIDVRNLRFQCEQELKSKIVNMKMAFLRSTNVSKIEKILFKSLTSSLHILRNLIRLKGKEPSYVRTDILKEISLEFGVDTAPLQDILDLRRGILNPSREKIVSLFTRLVETLEVISDKVDRL